MLDLNQHVFLDLILCVRSLLWVYFSELEKLIVSVDCLAESDSGSGLVDLQTLPWKWLADFELLVNCEGPYHIVCLGLYPPQSLDVKILCFLGVSRHDGGRVELFQPSL